MLPAGPRPAVAGDGGSVDVFEVAFWRTPSRAGEIAAVLKRTQASLVVVSEGLGQSEAAVVGFLAESGIDVEVLLRGDPDSLSASAGRRLAEAVERGASLRFGEPGGDGSASFAIVDRETVCFGAMSRGGEPAAGLVAVFDDDDTAEELEEAFRDAWSDATRWSPPVAPAPAEDPAAGETERAEKTRPDGPESPALSGMEAVGQPSVKEVIQLAEDRDDYVSDLRKLPSAPSSDWPVSRHDLYLYLGSDLLGEGEDDDSLSDGLEDLLAPLADEVDGISRIEVFLEQGPDEQTVAQWLAELFDLSAEDVRFHRASTPIASHFATAPSDISEPTLGVTVIGAHVPRLVLWGVPAAPHSGLRADP
jgi:hypothetical protein